MNVVENEIIKELSKKFGKKEKMIFIMFEESLKLGCNNVEAEENIIDFINTKWFSMTMSTNVNVLSTMNKIWNYIIKYNKINKNKSIRW